MLEKEDPFTPRTSPATLRDVADVAGHPIGRSGQPTSCGCSATRAAIRRFFPIATTTHWATGAVERLSRPGTVDPTSDDGSPVKHSLFNVFKMLRPVVVLDEAQ